MTGKGNQNATKYCEEGTLKRYREGKDFISVVETKAGSERVELETAGAAGTPSPGCPYLEGITGRPKSNFEKHSMK